MKCGNEQMNRTELAAGFVDMAAFMTDCILV